MKILSVAQPKFLLSVVDVSSLERRILCLLEGRRQWTKRGRIVSTLAGVAAMAIVCGSDMYFGIRPVAASQATEKPTAFEVATIKPSDPNVRYSNFGFNGSHHFITQNIDLISVIKFAYDLNMGSNDQITGGPGWLSTARFDIDAKPEDVLLTEFKTMPIEEQMKIVRPMIRTLLAERFHLKVHHETRELRVDVLAPAKGGSKVKVSSDQRDEKSWEGLHMDRPGHFEGKRATMTMFANVLGHQPEVGGRMVIDKTGLAGHYDFDIQWAPIGSEQGGPSLFTAMQEQMGLQVESTKAPVDVLAIDQVEQPSEN